jgi:hypothetical protein
MRKGSHMAALSHFDFIDAPGKTRTFGLLIRSQTLYPTELRVQRKTSGGILGIFRFAVTR